jgi:outer membrane protein TolC
MMSRPSLIVMFLTVAALPARAAVLTLAEVERCAVANDAAAASRAETDAAAADLEAARTGRRPVITLNTDASFAPGGHLVDVTSPDGQHFLVQGSQTIGHSGAFEPVVRFGSVASVQANLFDFGRTASRIRAAEHRLLSSHSDAEAIRTENVRAAREAYLGWSVAYARLDITERHARAVRAQAQALRGSIAEGRSPPGEENTARQAEATVELETLDAAGELERAEIAVRQIVGASWTPLSTPDLTFLEAPVVGSSSRTSFDAKTLDEQAAASSALADSLVRDHAPLVTASGDLGVRGQEASVFPVYRVGVVLTVPLWDGGLGSAQAHSAQARSDQLRSEARSLLKASRDEQERVAAELARASARLDVSRRLQRLAQDDLAQARERHRLGAVDLRALFDAYDRLARAEDRELSAKADRIRAGLHVKP